MTRWGLITLTVLAGAAAAAAPASAETYCVKKPKCVKAGGTPAPSIGAAIFGAGLSAGTDRIELGPREFSNGPWTAAGGNPVRIVGSGPAKTTLRRMANANSQVVLALEDPASRVRGLAVRLGEGVSVTGIRTAGRVSNVRVSTKSVSNQTGVMLLSGGTLRRARVRMPRDGANTAISAALPGTRIDRTIASGAYAAVAGSYMAPSRITRSKFTGGTHALLAASSLTIDQALLRMPAGGAAIFAPLVAPGKSRMVGRHLTIVGQGGDTGLLYTVPVSIGNCPEATLVLRNSIIRGFTTHLTRQVVGAGCIGTPKANLNVAWSALDRSKVIQSGAGKFTAKRNTRANPRFVAPKKGNYRLRANSKLVDRGQPGKPKKGESKRDLDGRKRVLDGDGKGGARRDIGAYERPAKR